MTRVAILLPLLIAPGMALAVPEHLAIIESGCSTQLQMSAAQCACLKSKAAALNEGQQAFVADAVSQDKASQVNLTQGMTVQELTEVGMFMTNAPAQCAKGQ